jgi:GT2 family glycosyltransferase
VITVVLALRGKAALLEHQLAALASQRYDGPWEVVAVDNDSTDACREVAMAWASRLPLRLIDGPRQALGPGPAKNLGARHAQGDILVFCDADDVVREGWLAAMAGAMSKADAAGGAIDYGPLNAPGAAPTDGLTLRQLPVALGFLPFSIGANHAVTRRAFDAVGGFPDERRDAGPEVDLCWRLQLAGFGLTFVPDAVVDKRAREELGALWSQHVGWGRTSVDLFRRYHPIGMRRSSPLRAVATYLWLLVRLPEWRSAAGRRRWAREGGVCWGRLTRSIGCRTLYL